MSIFPLRFMVYIQIFEQSLRRDIEGLVEDEQAAFITIKLANDNIRIIDRIIKNIRRTTIGFRNLIAAKLDGLMYAGEIVLISEKENFNKQ